MEQLGNMVYIDMAVRPFSTTASASAVAMRWSGCRRRNHAFEKIGPVLAVSVSRSYLSMEATKSAIRIVAEGCEIWLAVGLLTSPVSASSWIETVGVVDRPEITHEARPGDPQPDLKISQGRSVSWAFKISRTASRIGMSLLMIRTCFSGRSHGRSDPCGQ